jgi:hypothetical protein
VRTGARLTCRRLRHRQEPSAHRPGAPPPPKWATASAAPPPPRWSTNSSRPPTTNTCPRPSPATADLLCLDELGHPELDQRGAELLFPVSTERGETASIAIASNVAFSEWARTFTDPRLCAAIVYRLTFDAHIIETGTDSYRLKTTRQRSQQPVA